MIAIKIRVYGACNCVAKSEPGAHHDTMREFGKDTPSDMYLVQGTNRRRRTEDNGPLCPRWKYFAGDMLKLPVFRIMRVKDDDQPGQSHEPEAE
jgi:hypothetical protein